MPQGETCAYFAAPFFSELHLEMVPGGFCGAPGALPYIVGARCPQHTPAALAGRPEVVVDPDLSLDGLMRRAGRVFNYRATDNALADERAIKSGKRASGRRNYYRTQKALAEAASANAAREK